MKYGIKELVGTLEFKGKHRLQIEGLLEYDEKGYVKDVVFVEIHENMALHNITRMQLTCGDLLAMSYGAKELFVLQKSLEIYTGGADVKRNDKCLGTYKKFTKSAHFSTQLYFGVAVSVLCDAHGNQKMPLRAKFDYYLNMTRNKGSVKSTLNIGFDIFSLQAFIERIRGLAEKIEDALFASQRIIAEENKQIKNNKGEADE